MTRTTLTILTLLAAGAAAVVAASALGGSGWFGLPAVPLTWYALAWLGAAAHRAWVRWHLRRESAKGGGPFVRAVETWAAVPKVSGGDAWFTRATAPTPKLERAVLFPGAAGHEEEAVLADLNAATAASRRALVTGLRDLQDLVVDALGSPTHPLFAESEAVLTVLGHRPPRFLSHLRAAATWRERRETVDPEHADEAIAVRLIEAGLPAAALSALGPEPATPRARRLRRLARFLALLRRGDSLRPEEYASWAPELVLLAGRGIPDLVPGSPVITAVAGGAAELASVVSRTPEVVADLVALAHDVSDLAPVVRQVLARVFAQRQQADGLRAAGAESPDRALTLHLRGIALFTEGRPREALAEFEGALAAAPDFAAAAYSLALTRRRLGDADGARTGFRQFAERRASDPDAQLVLARYLSDEGRRDEARVVFERTLERFPRSLPLRMTFAQALASWGRPAEAAAQVEAAHRDHPGDPRLALWAGRARVHGGRAKDAVRPLRLAADRLQGLERAEAMFWLVAAYREQGHHDKALPLATKLVLHLGSGQDTMLDDLAEYLEERHEYLLARDAADRARRLRGDEWT